MAEATAEPFVATKSFDVTIPHESTIQIPPHPRCAGKFAKRPVTSSKQTIDDTARLKMCSFASIEAALFFKSVVWRGWVRVYFFFGLLVWVPAFAAAGRTT